MTDVLGCFMVVDMSQNSDCTLYEPLVRYHLRLQRAAPGKSRAPRVKFLFAETVAPQEQGLREGCAVQPQ